MQIKAYQPIKQYTKKVKKEIVSIGFPVSVLENITSLAKEKGFEISQTDNEGIIRITTNGSCEGSFEEWKISIKLQEPVQSNGKLSIVDNNLDKCKLKKLCSS